LRRGAKVLLRPILQSARGWAGCRGLGGLRSAPQRCGSYWRGRPVLHIVYRIVGVFATLFYPVSHYFARSLCAAAWCGWGAGASWSAWH